MARIGQAAERLLLRGRVREARLAELGAGSFQSDANATSDPLAAGAKAEALDWWQPWL